MNTIDITPIVNAAIALIGDYLDDSVADFLEKTVL